MKLGQLIDALAEREVSGPEDVEIHSIAYDSRKVIPGTLFVAVRGEHTDGHRYISSAMAKGAVAVVVDRGDSEQAQTTIQDSYDR